MYQRGFSFHKKKHDYLLSSSGGNELKNKRPPSRIFQYVNILQGGKDNPKSDGGPSDCYLSELYAQLKKLMDSRPGYRASSQEDEAEDPKVLNVGLYTTGHQWRGGETLPPRLGNRLV